MEPVVTPEATRADAGPPSVMAEGPGGVLREIGLVHGRTLLGAIDGHVGAMHHVRPWLVAQREAILEDVADAWFATGGDNWLPDLDPVWLSERLAALPPDRRAREGEAVADLLTWAVAQGLIAGGEADPPPLAA